MSTKKLIAQIVVALLFVGSLAACDKKEQPEAMAPVAPAAVENEQPAAAENQAVVVAEPEAAMPADQEAAPQAEMEPAEEAAPANPAAAAQH